MNRINTIPTKAMKYFDNLSIRVKLLVLFVVLSVIPAVIIGVISYSKSTGAIETKVNRYSLQILEQTSENINQMLKSYEMICYSIAKSSEIIETINKSDNSFDIDSVLMIRGYLQNIITSRRDEIASIFLYSAGGREFREGDTLATAILNYQRSVLFKNTKAANGRIVWTTSAEVPDEFRSKGFLTVSRLLMDPVTQKNEGSVLIFLKEKTIENLYNKFLLEKGGVIFVLDEEGRVISHPNKDLLGKEMPDLKDSNVLKSENGCFRWNAGREEKLVSFWTMNQSKGLKIVSIVPYNTLMSEVVNIRSTSVLIILVCIGFSLVSAYVVSNKVSRPIINIAEGITSVEKQYDDDFLNKLEDDINFIDVESVKQIIKSVDGKTPKNNIGYHQEAPQANTDKSNEVDKIGKSAASMTKRIETLTKEVYKQKLLKREAELKSLQSQINPHFLYNVLEKIKGIAELEGSRKSAEMIAALGKLFRLNMSRGKDVIMIKQELEHMNLYLSLQSLGKKDKYKVKSDIEEGIEECAIIKMTLQPIIENAIMHGLESVAGRDMISVRGYKSGQDIFLEIRDNGKGMSSEKLSRINRAISDSSGEIPSEQGSGLALKNVHERICLYFGKNYGVSISSSENTGTAVVVKIPMISFYEWEERHETANS